MVKSILLGIQDYMKDCFHDRVAADAEMMGCRLYEKVTYFDGNKTFNRWVSTVTWKEGNIWHYIRQRLYARKNKKEL